MFSDPAYHIEVDLSGLVRGDYVSRWTANVAAVTAGILTRDEIRAQEGYGSITETQSAPPAAPPGPMDQTQPGPAGHAGAGL